ncbi:MAG: GIY-YIG nuclease family protein [Crocinitomicaceae bacterium]|nr:GIY-YIG nuclease family protein [Crocinitomicaceae bacterium]
MYFVYVLYSEKAKCKYTGYTEDLTRRLNEHNPALLRYNYFLVGCNE